MSQIKIRNLSFSYSGSFDKIFDNINLQLDSEWKLGLVGRNGKGKTTFLKLLQGELPFEGEIYSTCAFEFFPFEIENKSQSVDNIIDVFFPYVEKWRVFKELSLLNLEDMDFHRPFNTFSNGEQTKILLAILFCKDNAFLLIDEPTNHLDLDGRKVLAKYLSKKSSYIIVSHDKRFLDNCIDHVMSINRADIAVQSGNLSSFLENKKRQDEFEFAENEKLQKQISRLKEASLRTEKWADKVEKSKYGGKRDSGLKADRGFIGAKSAKMMKQSIIMKNRVENSIEEKSSLLKNVDKEAEIKINCIEFFKSNLLTVKDVVIQFGERKINSPLSFQVNSHDRIALIGKNGSGKTSVIKAVLGLINSYSGEIEFNKNLKISYVSQDTSFVRGNLDEFCFENKVDKTMLLTMLFKFGFERIQFEKLLQDFSEGQKKKLLIAKSLCEQANLYLWDEPLNYIDIISREQIQNMLVASDASMLFVEHDENFCDNVATKKVEIFLD